MVWLKDLGCDMNTLHMQPTGDALEVTRAAVWPERLCSQRGCVIRVAVCWEHSM